MTKSEQLCGCEFEQFALKYRKVTNKEGKKTQNKTIISNTF